MTISNPPARPALTDEQILGLEPLPEGVTDAAATSPAPASDREASDTGANTEDAPQSPGGESDPAWLRSLESQPEAAAEARRWRDAAADVAALDSAYFSGDPGARTGLAARLYDSDPAAFREMLSAGARMLADRNPAGLAELARALGVPVTPVIASPETRSLAPAAQRLSQNDVAAAANPGVFPAEGYRTFEAQTNGEVEQRVRESIDRTLGATLPQGVADGARRRIAEDVFREVHASLAADGELGRQIGDVLRGWRFDDASRQQIVSVVSGRARAVLPEVARRVVSEWTSSVLASDRAKNARIDAAISRREVTGGRLPEPISASALRPRDIDYRRLSDEQILDM